ncbi:hypothetical protein M885DRAFT_612900 [Pelagophyceae sp. CCMP2097]|nr:hypothetical protein M885DRAFT_612900 [Pelagophyceae sp. CCMP2097]
MGDDAFAPLALLRSGAAFEPREAERMRCAKVYRIASDGAWCGRLVSTSKLRQTWRLCFGPGGQEHRIELLASLRSGKREVRFDRAVAVAAKEDARLAWLVPGHARGAAHRALEELDAPTAQETDDLEAAIEEASRGEVSSKLRERSELVQDVDLQADADPNVHLVASNALVKLYKVQLEPGVFGIEVLLRNESCASRRIEVAAIASGVQLPGIAAGDVLVASRVAINGKPLPRGAAASELQELVRSNPRYALTAVDALLWHKRAVGDGDSGDELTIHCGNGALGVEWARLVSKPDAPAQSRAPHIDGTFAAVSINGQAKQLNVKRGDVLVGINHDPIPRHLPAATLLQKFSAAAARGPPTLNLWRCYDADVYDSILAQCDAAVKHALAVNPSVSATLPKRARAATAASCCG